MSFIITAKTHQGATVEQVVEMRRYADVCALVTNSDYIISNEDRLKIAQWESQHFKSGHIPFFVHHSQLFALKWWIANNAPGYDCAIYVYAGGIEHPNETPGGVVSVIGKEEIPCGQPLHSN